MKKQGLRALATATALAATMGLASPATAQDAGDWQVKILGSGVLPDGKIDRIDLDLVGLPAGTQTKANDNFVPTAAIEYFFTPQVSLETICCLTQHDVDTTTGLPAGSELVSNAKLVPATFTLKYHLNAGGVSPYVGAGATYFLWLDVNPGTTAKAVGATKTTFSDELGFVLQAGVDVPVNPNGMSVSLDAKRYFVDTTARWYAGSTEVIQTKHKLDPWVLSAGVGFRF
jgi:outer membrane protein